MVLNMKIDLKESYADENLVIRRKEPSTPIPDVSLGTFLFDKLDRWGDGTRVPAIVISPFAKRHFVDHTTYDTTSILALIEKRFGLAPLSHRDAAAAPLLGAFNFSLAP